MHTLSLKEQREQLEARAFSSVELTQHYLNRIRQLDPTLNSFITVTEENALAEAAAADARLAQGDTAPLLGLPIAHKDIFCTRGVRTSCGSRMLDNYIAPYDATVVSNIAAAGAISLGKTNMDEFAMGSSNETSYYGPVRNPWNTDCVPGGSSGGSAACVAAGLASAATATDTGGSIRQPAALCGLTGLKPSYGRVSRWGMIAFASSLDQAGTLTRSAEDAALLLQAMASYDAQDATCIKHAIPDYSATLNDSLKGKVIGVPEEYFSEGLHAGTEHAVREAIRVFESLGAKVQSISLPHTALAVPTYYVIAPAECSANLSRFDGVRFGYRCDAPDNLMDLYCRSRGEGFGEEVKRRILVGTYALSAGYYDAYYRKAQQVRRLIKLDFDTAFEKVDFIVGPTAPTPAFKFGEKGDDPVAMYLEDIYTIATNLAGLPGMSIPCGLVDNKPVGLQLIGRYFDESLLLNAGHCFQSQTEHHKIMAPLFNDEVQA